MEIEGICIPGKWLAFGGFRHCCFGSERQECWCAGGSVPSSVPVAFPFPFIHFRRSSSPCSWMSESYLAFLYRWKNVRKQVGSNLGLLACFINDSVFLDASNISPVSLTALSGVIIEGYSEEGGLSPVIVEDNKSLSKLEQILTGLWSSSKWMLLIVLTWILRWRWHQIVWQILQQHEPKKQRFLTFPLCDSFSLF